MYETSKISKEQRLVNQTVFFDLSRSHVVNVENGRRFVEIDGVRTYCHLFEMQILPYMKEIMPLFEKRKSRFGTTIVLYASDFNSNLSTQEAKDLIKESTKLKKKGFRPLSILNGTSSHPDKRG